MTDQNTAPTPGAVLDAEGVKLLLPGDLLRVVDPHPGAHAVGDVVEVCADGEPEWVNIMLDGIRVQQYPTRFSFLGRPDADGWIEWHGGENPAGHALVEVKLRNGCTTTETASGFPWDHDEIMPYADIIAYRLARPTPEGEGTPLDEAERIAEASERGFTADAQREPGAGELGLEYRKTATIRARQWFKDGDHPAVIRKSAPNRYADEGIPWCPTLEGGHVVTPGDWIATGVQGEHWPIKPDVFAATYDPVEKGDERRLSDPVSPLTSDLHKDTAYLVNSFAVALAHKLLDAQQKYGYSNGWLTDDWEAKCKADLLDHVHKGDPLDVAAYAAFCWARNWSTTPSDHTQAHAKIARLEEALAFQRITSRLLETRALSAEADAAKVRGALVRLLEINEEWVGAAEPGSAYDQAHQALAAKTERRA